MWIVIGIILLIGLAAAFYFNDWPDVLVGTVFIGVGLGIAFLILCVAAAITSDVQRGKVPVTVTVTRADGTIESWTGPNASVNFTQPNVAKIHDYENHRNLLFVGTINVTQAAEQ